MANGPQGRHHFQKEVLRVVRQETVSSVAETSASASGHRPSSSQKSRTETECQKVCSLSCAESNLCGGYMGLDYDAGTAVSGTCRIHSKHPEERHVRPESHKNRYFQRLLGLVAAVSMVIPLGLLHMRQFQLWLRTRGFHLRANHQRQIRVLRQGLSYSLCGSDPGF